MGYFNLLPCKKSKICKIFTRNLEIYEQLEKINKLYLDFLYFYKKEYKKAKQYGHKNRKEELDFLGLKKLEKAFNIVLSILKFCLRANITLNSYFKLHKKPTISRRCFYQHKLKFCNMCDRTIQNYYLHI